MKIALVGGFQFPYGDAAGARYRMMSVALKKLGAEVFVISQLPYIPRQEDRCNDRSHKYMDIPYWSSVVEQTFQRSYLKSSLNILKSAAISAEILKKLIWTQKIDIVYFSGSFNIYLWPILRVARKYNIPIVNEVMEWFSSFAFYGRWLHPLAWDHEICMRITNKQLNGIIVISNYLFDYYKQSILHTILIPSLGEFSTELPQWVSSNDEFKIGYFGTPSQKDGIFDMMEAITILARRGREFEFLLAGDDGRAGNLKKVRQLVNSDPLLNKKVKLLGKIDQQQIPEVFSQCNVMLLARPLDRFALAGCPQKLPEYMALGKPVVVTAVGDIPCYVRDGVDGFVVEPDNPFAFADAIEKIMDLPDQGQVMGRAAWKQGKSIFDADVHAQRLLHFFEGIIS